MAIRKEIESFEEQFKAGKKTEKDALAIIINMLIDLENKMSHLEEQMRNLPKNR